MNMFEKYNAEVKRTQHVINNMFKKMIRGLGLLLTQARWNYYNSMGVGI